jgi:exodeoxyribonuclease-3
MKNKPLKIIYGLKYNDQEIDHEGRIIVVEIKNYYIINVYTPNSGEGLHRLDWRTNIWDKAFISYMNKLQKIKPIIICGDLNVAHNEIDLKNPKTNVKTAGFTKEERESFNILLNDLKLIDVYRTLYPNKIEYTYWSYKYKARSRNIGWRIDYFLITEKIIKNIKTCHIIQNILGSDHAPIELLFK